MNSLKMVTSPTIENENISSGNTKIFDDLDVLFKSVINKSNVIILCYLFGTYLTYPPCFLVLEKDILWFFYIITEYHLFSFNYLIFCSRKSLQKLPQAEIFHSVWAGYWL